MLINASRISVVASPPPAARLLLGRIAAEYAPFIRMNRGELYVAIDRRKIHRG